MRTAWLVALAACGRVDFNPHDDASNAGDASSCPASALLCDDFETGDLAKWDGTRISTGGLLLVDPTAARRGRFGLDATVPIVGPGSISAPCLIVTPTSMLAIRSWVFGQVQAINFDAVILMANLPDCNTGGGNQYVSVGCANGTLYATESSTQAGIVDHAAGACPPAASWSCIELDYIFGASPRIQLFVDDANVLDVAPSDPAPMMHTTYTGVTRADTVGYHDFVDDVVIATAHVGCN